MWLCSAAIPAKSWVPCCCLHSLVRAVLALGARPLARTATGRDGIRRVASTVTERPDLRAETTFEVRGATYRLAVLRGPEMAPLMPLYRDAFGRGLFSSEWLTRKYACERRGVGGFSCAAFTQSGEAAGSVGVLPWPVRFGDRVETAGQMVDVATGSAHRGRGLFVRLAEMAREVCEAAGVSFLFGFPNEAAYPIWINKLGYQHSDDLVEHRLPIRTIWAERVARRVGALRPFYERHVQRTLSADVAADPVLENSVLLEGFAGTDRDRAFHAYKSSFAGSRVLAIDGGRVWLNLRHGLLVGDLEALSEADLDRTAHALERLARRLGVHQILFQASKDTRFSPFFANRFRTLPGMPVIYRNLRSQIPREKLRFTFGDLDNF